MCPFVSKMTENERKLGNLWHNKQLNLTTFQLLTSLILKDEKKMKKIDFKFKSLSNQG